MAGNTISGAIGTMVGDFSDQLWLVVPIGLGIAAVIWGLPKGVAFLKKLAK
jgi:hypothetical protein